VLPAASPTAAATAAGPTRHPVTGFAASQWLSGTLLGTLGTSLADVRTMIGASSGTAATLTGAGVGVALIDTGVAPVPGIPAAQLVNGPDLSFESQSPNLRYLDTYGHGTHMAGIIIGNDTASGAKGLAPKAKLTSVKVGTATGAVDVSQVIAAVDWVVENRNHDPANPIRVLNLSYGSGGDPSTWTDPLQYAVEQAWQAGIVVVVAAGNNGNTSTRLTNPATDKYVLSVGATATNGTVSKTDDSLATFTNLGNTGKQVDVLAPGQSILSLSDPGSWVDLSFPLARVGTTLFRGSGTSQAAAVTSAAIALLLQKRPGLDPDQVKDIIKRGTVVPNGKAKTLGLKQVDLTSALTLSTGFGARQYYFDDSNGDGHLDPARGTSRVVTNNVPLSGDRTVWGSFDGRVWSGYAKYQNSWKGGVWMGTRLAGDGWTGTSFASKTWAPATWTGKPWSGDTWVDPSWSGRFWAGRFWASTGVWSGRFWASDDWAGSTWG
jgi:serine protease AprX